MLDVDSEFRVRAGVLPLDVFEASIQHEFLSGLRVLRKDFLELLENVNEDVIRCVLFDSRKRKRDGMMMGDGETKVQ